MNPHWLAHLDAHIATGQVAAAAESAEILSWLLKLEPEQRWCLVLRRDPCLERLLAEDYRRLLILMVELESGAIAHAPEPPEPCVALDADDAPPPALPAPVPTAPAGWRLAPVSRLAAVFLLSLLGAAGGFWLMQQQEQRRLANLEQEARALLRTLESRDDIRAELNSAESQRQRQNLLAIAALGALGARLTDGRPFAAELAALRAVWSDAPELAAALAPLDALADQGLTPPALLIDRLTDLRERQETERAALLEQARLEALDLDRFYPRARTLVARRAAAAEALKLARRSDWRGAAHALDGIDDPDYRAWRAAAEQRAAAEATLNGLLDRIWSQWTAALATAPPANAGATDAMPAASPVAAPP